MPKKPASTAAPATIALMIHRRPALLVSPPSLAAPGAPFGSRVATLIFLSPSRRPDIGGFPPFPLAAGYWKAARADSVIRAAILHCWGRGPEEQEEGVFKPCG